jgi:hypothetical protein
LATSYLLANGMRRKADQSSACSQRVIAMPKGTVFPTPAHARTSQSAKPLESAVLSTAHGQKLRLTSSRHQSAERNCEPLSTTMKRVS